MDTVRLLLAEHNALARLRHETCAELLFGSSLIVATTPQGQIIFAMIAAGIAGRDGDFFVGL